MKIRHLRSTVLALLASALLLGGTLAAQEGPLDTSPPKGITPEEIIQKFAAKEKEFKQARDQYTFRQDVKVQTMDGDTPDGEFREITDVLFDDSGKRIENVVFAPQATLTRISMTKEDLDDIHHTMPFVLTTEEIPEYQIIYVGKQKEDELDTYVFDVAPKQIQKNRRYFQGRIWVDQQDLQIVKSKGKAVPDIRKKNEENLFPGFTTYREQIDGHYWFPTYTRADDTLHFSGGDVPIRIIIKYSNYKRYGSKSRITYEGQEVQKAEQKPPQQQPPPK